MTRTYRDELDILVDKVEGNNDYEWTELVDELELNCHPDSLRKSFNVGRYSGYRVYKYLNGMIWDDLLFISHYSTLHKTNEFTT